MHELAYKKNWIVWAEIITKANNCVKYTLMSRAVVSNFTDNLHGDGSFPKECANLTENKDK